MNEPSSVPCDGLKEGFDRLLALGLLLVFSPLYLLIAAFIKLEGLLDPAARGPVFYCQVRISEGREFQFFKFRITKVSVLYEEPSRRRRDRFKTLERDEYCTVVGRWIKKYYLDELPQLLNILRGEMSWVGPRPFPVEDYKQDVSKGFFQKKVIRAGLTGLPQVYKGRMEGKTDVSLDDEYIAACRARSPVRRFVYDISILARTVRTVLEGKGL